MGKRGPAPTPTPILRARGSWRADTPERQAEPQYTGIPDKPACLTGEAAREWTRLVKVLEPVGVLTCADRGALACVCLAWAGVVASTKQSARTQRGALDCYLKAAAKFGLSPSDRSKVQVADGKDADDKKARFFKAS